MSFILHGGFYRKEQSSACNRNIFKNILLLKSFYKPFHWKEPGLVRKSLLWNFKRSKWKNKKTLPHTVFASMTCDFISVIEHTNNQTKIKAQLLEVLKKTSLRILYKYKFVRFNLLSLLLQYVNFHSTASIQITPPQKWQLDNASQMSILTLKLYGANCFFCFFWANQSIFTRHWHCGSVLTVGLPLIWYTFNWRWLCCNHISFFSSLNVYGLILNLI